jgi:MFS family permease
MASSPETTDSRSPRLAASASFIGSTVEYYDFFAYGAATALVFDKLFFSALDPAIAVLAAMATFGAGYVARPAGAVVFGHIGDRVGRKTALIATLLIMGVATVLIGCLPTYAQIGVAAPILLVSLRLLQGASAAGEWGGAVALSLEHAPSHRRALYASFTNSGALAGSALASVVFVAVSTLPRADFLSWGWRIPFLLSSVLVVIGLVLRAKLPEPPSFEALRRSRKRAALPLVTVLRDHWQSVLRVIGCSTYTVIATIAGVFALSYAVGVNAATMTTMLVVKLVSTTAAVAVQPLCGLLADRIGRRPVFATGGIICAGATFLLFWAIGEHNVPLIFLGHFLLVAIGYSMPNGVAPAMYAEMFSTEVRYTGTALSSQLGQLITGFAPTIAAGLVVAANGGWIWVAVATAGACLTSALATLTVRESYRVAFENLGVRGASEKPPEPVAGAAAASVSPRGVGR